MDEWGTDVSTVYYLGILNLLYLPCAEFSLYLIKSVCIRSPCLNDWSSYLEDVKFQSDTYTTHFHYSKHWLSPLIQAKGSFTPHSLKSLSGVFDRALETSWPTKSIEFLKALRSMLKSDIDVTNTLNVIDMNATFSNYVLQVTDATMIFIALDWFTAPKSPNGFSTNITNWTFFKIVPIRGTVMRIPSQCVYDSMRGGITLSGSTSCSVSLHQ